MDDKTSAFFYWRRAPKADGTQMVRSFDVYIVLKREGKYNRFKNWMVAVTVEGFLLCPNMLVEQLVRLQLPADVRNIPIKPMHTTSAVVLCCGDALFVAGVRKNLYIFNLSNSQVS